MRRKKILTLFSLILSPSQSNSNLNFPWLQMQELVSWNHKMTTKPMFWPFLLGFLPITAYHMPFSMAAGKPSARGCWQVTESAVCAWAEAQGTKHHRGTHSIRDLFLLLSKWLQPGNLGGAWDPATLLLPPLSRQWASFMAEKETAAKRKGLKDKGPSWKCHLFEF